jgi:hypothetical protein
MIYIIAIAVYLLSVWLVWLYIKIAYSEDGRFHGLDTEMVDIVITVFPILNTYFAILVFIFLPPKEIKNRNFNNLFKVKK